jgi:uncharacterized Tic20 family protein
MACHWRRLRGGHSFGNIIGPLVVWLKKNSRRHRDQGKESLNFQSRCALIFMLCGITISFLIGLLFLSGAVPDFNHVGAVRANNGEQYRYPMTIRFFN